MYGPDVCATGNSEIKFIFPLACIYSNPYSCNSAPSTWTGSFWYIDLMHRVDLCKNLLGLEAPVYLLLQRLMLIWSMSQLRTPKAMERPDRGTGLLSYKVSALRRWTWIFAYSAWLIETIFVQKLIVTSIRWNCSCLTSLFFLPFVSAWSCLIFP